MTTTWDQDRVSKDCDTPLTRFDPHMVTLSVPFIGVSILTLLFPESASLAKATIYCMLVSHWGLPQEVMRAGGPLPLWHYFRSCCAVLAYERLR